MPIFPNSSVREFLTQRIVAFGRQPRIFEERTMRPRLDQV